MLDDPFDILLAHNAWANDQVFARCADLTAEELHQRFDIGPGSVHDVLLHIIAGYRWWTDRIDDRSPRTFLETGELRYSLDELRRLNDEAHADMVGVIRRLRDEGRMREVLLSRQPPGKKFARVTGVLHCFTHAFHHRAQALNMLRRLRPDMEALELDLPHWQVNGEG